MADTRNAQPANAADSAAETDGAAIRADARTRVRFEGVCALAREVGCSAAFLSQILHGRKVPGTRLAARLRARGIVRTLPRAGSLHRQREGEAAE